MAATRALAQDEPQARPPVEIPDFSMLDDYIVEPKYTVSLSLRYVGRTQATFRGLGTIATAHEATDMTSEVARTYDNGAVGFDTRVDDEGNKLASDGRTNTWNFLSRSQITPDESGVTFNTYQTTSEGAQMGVSSRPTVGADVEFAREFGRFGRPGVEGRGQFTWGVLWGFGLGDVNAKSRGSIRATLHTLTDTYSLLGAAPPTLTEQDADADGTPDRDASGNIITTGYSSPSSTTETVTNADGTTTSLTIDTSVLLANRPDTRTETTQPEGAEIDGFWQVKGASLTLRVGPWLRWQPREHVALRVSAGGTLSLLGLSMRHDERLTLSDVTSVVEDSDETKVRSYGIGGLFGGVDMEWWLTERTGFFGAGYYETTSRDVNLDGGGGRSAEVKFSGGLGVRAGMTYRF